MYQKKYLKYKNKYMQLKYGGRAIYMIHDNGGRPFKCVIDRNSISIYKQKQRDSNNENTYEEKPSLIFHPERIMIGRSPLNSMTKFSGGHGPEFDGNTILLDMGSNEYIYIGSEIWSFDAEEKIIDYISPVGNNDVPYPYAIDTARNIYLITFDVMIVYRDDVAEKMKQYDDPTDYYLEHSLITADRGTIPPTLPKTDMQIDTWIVGKEPYTLRYKPIPERDREEKMYTIDSNGVKRLLTKNGYTDLMNKFAALQSFRPLPKKKVYLDRDIRGSLFGFYMDAISAVSKQ